MAAHQIDVVIGGDKIAAKATQTNVAQIAAANVFRITIEDTATKQDVLKALEIIEQVVLEDTWPMNP